MKHCNHESERYSYISWLNVLSAFAVVILHANGSFWAYRADYTWAINNFVECFFYFAVPVFFMLTGATLFDYTERYSTKMFFQKRFRKTVIPFLFWSVIVLLLEISKKPKEFFINLRFDSIFNGIFATKYLNVFWFFVPLFCIYLCVPLFANIRQEKKLKVLNYLACAAFILNVSIPFVVSIVNVLFDWNIEWKYSVLVLSDYLLFAVIGYLLHHYQLNQHQRLIIYIGALIGLGMHCFGTYYAARKLGWIFDIFKGYTNLPSVIYAVGVFVFVKYNAHRIPSKKLHLAISKLKEYTFAMYLIHMLVFKPITKMLSLLHIVDTSPIFTVLMTVINISFCILITYLLRKIPVFKSVVP